MFRNWARAFRANRVARVINIHARWRERLPLYSLSHFLPAFSLSGRTATPGRVAGKRVSSVSAGSDNWKGCVSSSDICLDGHYVNRALPGPSRGAIKFHETCPPPPPPSPSPSTCLANHARLSRFGFNGTKKLAESHALLPRDTNLLR